jgi:phospholipid N-methyltransferase
MAQQAPSPTGVANTGSFLKEFVKAPTVVGAVAPSSSALAEEMVKGTGLERARAVVEFGPGTGSFSRVIREGLAPGAKFFVIEKSAAMAERFRKTLPGVQMYLGSASDVPELCRIEGLSGHSCVDVVYSGLPFASFAEDVQRTILERTVQVLRPGGMLVTFAYAGFSAMTAGGRRFRKSLPKYFSDVKTSGVVWRNAPPAFVYRCVK